MKKEVLFTFALLFSLSIVSAIPGMPHQFYGEVIVNGEPIQDNNIVSASINGEEYSTITMNGKYGFAPNGFFINDFNSQNRGDLITFYVGGMEAGTFIFSNAGYTNLDFSLTTECGDGYCLGDETCSRCEEDCGECSTPTIYIESPIDKHTYEETKVDIKVSSDQEIQIWMYSLNKATPIVFDPNITLTLLDEDYDLEIIAMNLAYRTGSEKVSFSIDLPYDYCGDNECAGEETCSNCPGDCGNCPVPSSSSGGGSSGGGGGGGFISNIINKLITPNTNSSNESATKEVESIPEEILEENPSNEPPKEIQEEKDFSARITGAVVGFSKSDAGKLISLILLVVVILGIILILVHLKNQKKKTKGKSEEFIPENDSEEKSENIFH